jgi:hypothetical protein
MLRVVLYLNGDTWLYSSEGREEVVEYLLRSGPKFIATGAHLDPGTGVIPPSWGAEVAFGRIAPGDVKDDGVAFVGQVHRALLQVLEITPQVCVLAIE